MIATKCVTLVWLCLLQHIVVEAVAIATEDIADIAAASANNIYQCDVRACWWLLPQQWCRKIQSVADDEHFQVEDVALQTFMA